MMKWVFSALLIISVIFGALEGKIAAVSEAALKSSVEAVELFLYLIGGMCMWGGLMRVAEKTKLTELTAKLFRPAAKKLFKGLDLNGGAFNAICMNFTANLLGLGNAATPLGLEAMRRLEAEESPGDTASRNMVIFIILNTASVTLLPATAAAIRMKHGSAAPMEILPAVWVTSFLSLAAGLAAAFALDGRGKGGGKDGER
ncbi:MAG: spore maturation protein A [Oscillospiraceae bacterium]|nr:spore maturation protein A [Oscillospiraceae bacterium]